MVARELEYYPEDMPTQKKVVKKKVVRKRVPKNNKNKGRSTLKLATMITIFAIMVGSLIFLLRYANITKARMELNKLETYKVELEKTKTDLIADLEGIKSSAKISEDAMYKLGMSYPKDGQVVYISVADEVVDFAEESPTGLDKFVSLLSDLF